MVFLASTVDVDAYVIIGIPSLSIFSYRAAVHAERAAPIIKSVLGGRSLMENIEYDINWNVTINNE